MRTALGERFVNAGVAEQNMVSVGAGLARAGLRPWLYSIAPFLYARPFEQIRNDVCFHNLPVVLVGNGGGYGYGVMGATHHALEDYGSLLALPHLRAYVPAFDRDVADLVPRLLAIDHPAYLRLGLAEEPSGAVIPAFAPWRRLLDGERGVVAVAGPLIGGLWNALRTLEASRRPTLWLVSELPPEPIPDAFLADLTRTGRLLVVEEHIEHGGLGAMLATALRGGERCPGSSPCAARCAIRRGCTARSASTAGSAVWTRYPWCSSSTRRTRMSLERVSEQDLFCVAAAVPAAPDSQPRAAGTAAATQKEPGNPLSRTSSEPAPRSLDLAEKIRRLQGPILVLGASGFVGANLLRAVLKVRPDAFGTTTRKPAWRLADLPDDRVLMTDLLIESNRDGLLERVQPRTVWDCVAYGAYSFETDSQLIYRTNFQLLTRLLPRLEKCGIQSYVHAGSSSEYGDNASGPAETASLAPNSDYAVSKAAAGHLLHYYGQKRGLPCVNLRLYSVYGPFEDAARLIPTVVRLGLEGSYPEFVDPAISRDFVSVDDVTEAFVDASLNLGPADFGASFNIGSGCKTTIGAVAALAKELFEISAEPAFTMPNRRWDVADWFADIAAPGIGWPGRRASRSATD